MDDLKWLIMALLALFLVCIFVGSKGGVGELFVNPPAPVGPGGTYGGSITQGTGQDSSFSTSSTIGGGQDLRDLKKTLQNIKNLAGSPYKDKITISSSSGARQTSPDKERIEIKVNRNVEGGINITGWRLESDISGVGDSIGKGSYLPYSGQVNSKVEIFLQATDKAIITTGRSPIGSSFRLNKCSGYFEQFQDFKPSIPRTCPKPIDDLPNVGVGAEADKCISFVERLSRCELYLESVPLDIGGTCHQYVTADVNYNYCVEVHKNDPDFYKREWRIYLERNDELWRKKREIIKLLDQQGRVVDAISY